MRNLTEDIKKMVNWILTIQILLVLTMTFIVPLNFWPELIESYTLKIQVFLLLLSYLVLEKMEKKLTNIKKTIDNAD